MKTLIFHDMLRKFVTILLKTQSTRFHRLLFRLITINRLLRLYTQNVNYLKVLLLELKI